MNRKKIGLVLRHVVAPVFLAAFWFGAVGIAIGSVIRTASKIAAGESGPLAVALIMLGAYYALRFIGSKLAR